MVLLERMLLHLHCWVNGLVLQMLPIVRGAALFGQSHIGVVVELA